MNLLYFVFPAYDITLLKRVGGREADLNDFGKEFCLETIRLKIKVYVNTMLIHRS